MIIVDGQGAQLKQVCVKIRGEKLILTPDSDPQLLFRAVKKLSTWIVRNRKQLSSR